jgi:hypothetical protein
MQPKTQVINSLHANVLTLLIGGFGNRMLLREETMVDARKHYNAQDTTHCNR